MKTASRLAILMLIIAFVASACGGPQHVRGTEHEELDEYAMSTGLDRKDLDKLYADNIDKLLNSSVVSMWERKAASEKPPVVAIFPMRNETSENVSRQLDALLSKFETDLVNGTAADVVSHENQAELIAEVKRQQSDAYDPSRLSNYGKQLGAQYFVTGKVYDQSEQVNGEKRVQYFMFVQVIDVATGAIKFQNEAAVTKGYVN